MPTSRSAKHPRPAPTSSRRLPLSIFHIAHSSEWDGVLEHYGTSTRGASLAEVGFIHASSAEQLPGVAERFYRDDPEDIVVLELDEAALGAEVRWEDGGGGELFPHIYGPIPRTAVVRVIPAHFEDDGGFALDA